VLCGAWVKKTALAFSLIFGFLILLGVGVESVEVSRANAFPRPTVVIVSPASGTYVTDSVWLNITIMSDYGDLELEYLLDGKGWTKMPMNYTGVDREYCSAVFLPELSEGSHSIEVLARGVSSSPPYIDSETRYFTVNLHPMPPIIITFVAIVVFLGLLVYFIKRK
jgi:hypothetical protein